MIRGGRTAERTEGDGEMDKGRQKGQRETERTEGDRKDRGRQKQNKYR